MKRRDFLAALSAGTLARAVSVEPELVLWNGNIHTMDTANPHAEAVAIAGGRFLAAGSGPGARGGAEAGAFDGGSDLG